MLMPYGKMKITKTSESDRIREYYECPTDCDDVFIRDTLEKNGGWLHKHYDTPEVDLVLDCMLEDWDSCSIQIDLQNANAKELCRVLEFLEDAEVVGGFTVYTVTNRCYRIENH